MRNEKPICDYVDAGRERLTGFVRELVRRPSENTPPRGAELACQEYLAGVLRGLGWETTLYRPDEVPGAAEHPLWWPGRDYTSRPNLGARRKGAGGGRSLVLSGHVDTAPRGAQPWTRDAFGGEVEGNRLYGRGSNDMKAGLAVNLFVAEAIGRLGLEPRGDLIFESVVDEEFGGVNGTIAGRLAGYNGDAAVIAEPSFLRICAAQRGGRVAHIRFTATGGILGDATPGAGTVDQLTTFLAAVPAFAAQRRRTAPVHAYYSGSADPVPVSVTKIFTAPWGNTEPITIPETCLVEFYWQSMPGERREDLDAQFFAWLDGVFPVRPQVEFPVRCLPGSAIARGEPVVAALSAAAESVLGAPPPVGGIEGPCDMFAFHEFGIPAVLWGPRGGNTHAADEYVEIDSAVAAAKALLLFIAEWCA